MDTDEKPYLSLELAQPITHKGESWDQLTFPAPTAGILKNASGTGDISATLQVLSDWSGVPVKALEELGPDDSNAAAKAVQEVIAPMAAVLGGLDPDAFEVPDFPFELELQDPVKLGRSGSEVEVLTIKRAIAGYMIGVPVEGATAGDFFKLASKLFQVPTSTIYHLSPRDAAPVLEVSIALFLRFQGI